MKDSQHGLDAVDVADKYIKANNERFSTLCVQLGSGD